MLLIVHRTWSATLSLCEGPMIYFLQHTDRYIKIGTTANLLARLARLQEEYGVLHLLGIMEGNKATEHCLHLQFGHLQRFGEWFRPEPELLSFIQLHTRPFSTPTPPARTDQAQGYMKQQQLRRLYYAHPQGLRDSEVAALLDISRMSAWRYRKILRAVPIQHGRYTLIPSPDEITEALNLLKVALSSSLIGPSAITSLFISTYIDH